MCKAKRKGLQTKKKIQNTVEGKMWREIVEFTLQIIIIKNATKAQMITRKRGIEQENMDNIRDRK